MLHRNRSFWHSSPCWLGVVLLCFPLVAWGQRAAEIESTPAASSVPTVPAAERTGTIQIDGELEEEGWKAAAAVSDFVQGEPIEGAPATEPTEVRVLFDGDAIYVGARLYDEQPGQIARQLVRRDERGQFDSFEVSFDPNLDRRTGYSFRVSAAGVQGDAYLYDDVEDDESWDAVWESAVRVDEQGWTAEMRIPLSQLRFQPSDEPQRWGVNFARRRVADNERTFFALESRRRRGRVSVFGRLSDLLIPSAGRRIELRPYALARARTAPSLEGNPFFDGQEAETTIGGDLRYGIGSSFALDATFNPDFGQVEVDPAVINLSAFETFFPEKRPFFVEDARIFDFNLSGRQNTLFYSRRIGREPRVRSQDDAEFTDVPAQSAILGAAKLTGRTAGGLSLGALAAVTNREEGRAYFVDDDELVAFLAEPRSYQGVFRAQQDLRAGNTVVGGIATALARDLPGDGSFDFLPGRAFNAGVDFEHTWADREWALWGFLAGSRIEGSPEAMTRVQRSSSHYFQRPDADYLEVDSAATSLQGVEWRLQFERRSGRHWTGAVWAAQRTPGFDVNDLGYFQGSERLDGGARVSYQEITPGKVLRSYRLNTFTFHNWRHSALDEPFSWDSWRHAHKNGSISASADLVFLNYWGVDMNARYSPQLLDDVATRGGPLLVEPAAWQVSMRGNTDRRRAVSFEPSFEYQWGEGGTSIESSLEMSIRPLPQIEIELEPELSWESDAAQYVSTTGDVGYAPTFGRRYLFADLDRRSFSLETRLNVTFTPTLTLQLFAQPLLSAGDYVTYKQLARAESFEFLRFKEGEAVDDGALCVGGEVCRVGNDERVDFDGDGVPDFTFDEPDFNVRSLRGNAVLRWEYRPGSALFLVWQQERFIEQDRFGEFDILNGTSALLDKQPENVFIIKGTYWLGM